MRLARAGRQKEAVGVVDFGSVVVRGRRTLAREYIEVSSGHPNSSDIDLRMKRTACVSTAVRAPGRMTKARHLSRGRIEQRPDREIARAVGGLLPPERAERSELFGLADGGVMARPAHARCAIELPPADRAE